MIDKIEPVLVKTGKFLMENFGKVQEFERKTPSDFVSYIDYESQNRIQKELKKLFPDIPFIGEEMKKTKTHNRYFLCDPLDGTNNYLRGIQNFSISLSLIEEDEPVFGATYIPFFKEFYYASKGKGAFKGEKVISVSPRTLKESILATGFPFREKELKKKFANLFLALFDNLVDLRRMGSAAQDLAYVAEGKFDGFFEYGLSPWDISAGILLIKEAGGKVSDFKGEPDYKTGDIVATNGLIHSELVEIVKEFTRNKT